MRLYKSAKARDVLMSQNLALSQAERRVLILCDGQRTRAVIENMLGDAAGATIDVLIAQGYLQASASAPAAVAPAAAPSDVVTETKPVLGGFSAFGKKILGGNATSVAAPATPPVPVQAAPVQPEPAAAIPAVDAASPAPTQPRRESRRSLAACKMYMLDMLQLQRSMESSALAVDIQTSAGETDLVDGLMQALRHLCATTKASMGQRIAQRLLETMPEAYVPGLEATLTELFESAPAATAGAQNVVAMRRGVA